MSDEQKPMTARELLAKGWELTRQSMALVGMPVPDYIEFKTDGAIQVRATRVAELDELEKAIGAIEEDIGRLVGGEPTLIFHHSNVERLRQEKAALIELKKRTKRSGSSETKTVIEALFPDISVKKKTPNEEAETAQWLAIRKEAGLKIDPETGEVDCIYGQTLDPYGVLDEWELPEEFHQYGREHFARSPGSDIWVHFSHLPAAVEEKLWAKLRSRRSAWANDDDEVPF